MDTVATRSMEMHTTRRLRRLVAHGPRCPECGGPLVFGEGCSACPVCGYSGCEPTGASGTVALRAASAGRAH